MQAFCDGGSNRAAVCALMGMDDPSKDAFGGRHGGWGAPHIPPEQTPPDRDRAPVKDPDADYAAGDVGGDYLHRWYARHEPEHPYGAWLRQRWLEEFEAWRRNNPASLPDIAAPQAVMLHTPPRTAVETDEGDPGDDL